MAYSEPWNIQKFDGIYIPVKQIAVSFRSSFKPQLLFLKLSFVDHFRCLASFWISLCIYKWYVTGKVTLGSVSGIFKHYSKAYSHICRTFSISGIFRTLTYSKVRQNLDACQTYCSVFGKGSRLQLFLQGAPSKTILDI